MITIKSIGGLLYCTTPYHPEFPKAARELGGRWHTPDWVFDFRDELRVRDLCISIWGNDGHPCELVTLRCVAGMEAWDRDGEMTDRYLCGRLVARVKSKHDDRAKLGQGVVVLSGGFYGFGSTKYPACGYSEGTIFELRDVPRNIAEQKRREAPELFEILESPVSPDASEIKQLSPEVQALIAERAELVSKLSQVDSKLTGLSPAVQKPVPVFEVADELLDND